MPYNSLISRADLAGLVPPEYSNEILAQTTEASAVLRLARRLRDIPASVKTMPVVSALPTAYFVSGDVGLKQTSEVNWANVTLTAEELAVIVPIPQNAFDDSNYPVWDVVQPLVVEAAGVAIDQAVLYGTNIPATWTTGLGAAGIVARCTAASHTISLASYTDLYEAVLGETAAGTDGLLMLIEADGFMATGHLAHTSMRGMLRNCRDSDGNPIFVADPSAAASYRLDGTECIFPTNGSIVAGSSLLVSGQWTELVYAMRQDISWMIADQGVIQDAQGAIVYNLFQQDMIALRMTMRLGFALPNPINRMNTTASTRCAFATLTA